MNLASKIDLIYHTITIGVVIDTNDPLEMGRVRARVPAFGDRQYHKTEDLPWCQYVSPVAGTVRSDTASRGSSDEKPTLGSVAYGFWSIPKIGSSVLVACINADPMQRIWLGCLPTETAVHTMPHGRYLYDTSSQAVSNKGQPEGPLSGEEQPIQPLYENQSKAFGGRQGNYEWRTRGADHSVGGNDQIILQINPGVVAKSPDDYNFPFTEDDGNVINSKSGYAKSRIDPNTPSEVTGQNYDSLTHGWTTPGFHSISMDDRVENCRMRFRTSAGHQIILDDTNERIYINTAEGENWVQIDQDGNVDVFCKRLSVHSTNEMNFTSGKTIRMFAKEGIHMVSQGELRIQTNNDLHIRSAGNIRTFCNGSNFTEAKGAIHVKTGSTLHLTSDGQMNLFASGNIVETGAQIHLNGPNAAPAASPAEQPAFWTNRVPSHEPWGRSPTASDFTHSPKYNYNDPNIDQDDKVRGKYWHR